MLFDLFGPLLGPLLLVILVIVVFNGRSSGRLYRDTTMLY